MIYINPLKFAWRQVLQPPTATPFRRTWPRQMTRVCGKASFRPNNCSPSIMKVVPPIHCFHVCSFNFKLWPRDPAETHCSCRSPTKLPKQPTLKESSSTCVSVSTCKEDCTDPRQKNIKLHQMAVWSVSPNALSTTSVYHGSGRLGVWDVRENGPADSNCAGFSVKRWSQQRISSSIDALKHTVQPTHFNTKCRFTGSAKAAAKPWSGATGGLEANVNWQM